MVEVSSKLPTPEQIADALLTKLQISEADRAALKQYNGGIDIRDQLVAEFRKGGINRSALTYVGGGKYRGFVGVPKETQRRLIAWSHADGQVSTDAALGAGNRQQELQAQGALARHRAELALRKQEAKQQITTDMLGTSGARTMSAAMTRALPKVASLTAAELLPPLALGTGLVTSVALTLDKGLELGVERQMGVTRNLPPAMMSKDQDEPVQVDTAHQPSTSAVPTDDELLKGELVPTGEAPPLATTTSLDEDTKPTGVQSAPQSGPPGLERIIPLLVTGASLGKLAADKAHETEKTVKPLVLMPTGDKDRAASDLAARIGGTPSVRIEGYGDREFDAVSDEYIGQTTNSLAAAKSPSNYLNPSKKAQLRETLRAAAETGRTALFEFTAGPPSAEVIGFLERNAERVGARYEVVIRAGGKNDVAGNN